MIGPMSYTAIQSMLDAAYPSGLRNYWRSNFLAAIDDDLIETILANAGGLPGFAGSAILFGDAIKPFALGAGYVNDMTGDEGAERIRAAYGAQYERLVEIKPTYDPSNFFRGNQNIHP